MHKLFVVSISCLIALFGVNLVVSQAPGAFGQGGQGGFGSQGGAFGAQGGQGGFGAPGVQGSFGGQPGQVGTPSLQGGQGGLGAPGASGAQQESPVTQTCLGCICEAISGCNRTTLCTGDVCGLFRLTWGYWSDAGKPTIAGESPTSETAYSNCANDPFCAASAVQGYMKRFGQDCNEDGRIDCYDHAAIHYRGGYGCKGDLPEKYRSTFNSCLGNFLKN